MDARFKGPRLIAPLFLMLLAGCAGFTVNRPSVQSSSPPNASVSLRYFGMHVGFISPGTPWPAAPFGTWRLWDANVTWKDLEPARGTWDFSRLDSLVALAQQHDTDVILPLALTPGWASQRPDESSAYTPGAAAPPANMQDWIDYVRAVSARYKRRIAYYEIWNEVNSRATWTGTPTQIAAMQRVAYSVIKSTDPSAKVISANLATSGGIPMLQQLLDLGYANTADIIGYHLYVCPSQPETIASLAAEVSSLLGHYGVNKPIWNTETGWLPPSTFANDDQAAGIVIRALLVARSAGVERFIWYAWDNHCCVSLFMTEADNATPTRAALAYANLQTWLVGSTLEPCAPDGSGTWSCQLRFADGRHGLILWNPNRPITVKAKLTWVPSEIEDIYGGEAPAPSTSVAVGQNPIMLCE